MSNVTDRLNIAQAIAVLKNYGFDLKGQDLGQLLENWVDHFSSAWVRLAVLESLYEGRYQSISVDHLLTFWEQRGEPHANFPQEFERLVLYKLIPA
ncbi:MAG: hypothetical protein VKL20_07560 [Synechocystis sp.]|nr:hypothetical protein [Synechocystis sp.]